MILMVAVQCSRYEEDCSVAKLNTFKFEVVYE